MYSKVNLQDHIFLVTRCRPVKKAHWNLFYICGMQAEAGKSQRAATDRRKKSNSMTAIIQRIGSIDRAVTADEIRAVQPILLFKFSSTCQSATKGRHWINQFECWDRENETCICQKNLNWRKYCFGCQFSHVSFSSKSNGNDSLMRNGDPPEQNTWPTYKLRKNAYPCNKYSTKTLSN